jgi:tetratricopeptide (TPR) repeat protein
MALDLIGEGSHDGAWDVLVPALEKATDAGISSGFLRWALALAAHGRHDLSAAMQHIMTALKLDPSAPVFLDTYRAIITGVRSLLADPTLDPAGESVPVLFDLLDNVGAADAHALFTVSVHHAMHGRLEQATDLAERLLELEPRAAEVVRYAASLYRAMRDERRAREYEALAEELDAEKNVLVFAKRRARS